MVRESLLPDLMVFHAVFGVRHGTGAQGDSALAKLQSLSLADYLS